jgi:hypothetical protein
MTTLPRFLLATGWGSALAAGIIYNAYCHYKMDHNVAPGRNPFRRWTRSDPHGYKGLRRFTFQYDPNDYTEAGQTYRRKAILSEILGLAWMFAAPWIIYAGG